MPPAPAPTSVRADAWTWAVRIFPTRSAAATACRGGHVKVNGARAKPAQQVRVGDTVTARTEGGIRIVVVTGLIEKRTSAPLAVQNFVDHSPPPPPRSAFSAPPPSRDRGAGRPTKRDRRQVERLRGRD